MYQPRQQGPLSPLKNRVVATTLAILSILIAHPAGTAAQSTPGIRGTVTSASTGAALGDVDVFLPGVGRRTLSDGSGRFLLVGLEPGSYTVVAERVGYGTVRTEVAVTDGSVADVAIRMEDRALSIPEVVVVASRSAKDLSEVAASVGVISGGAIAQTNPGHPSEIMGQVPGVYVNVTGGEGHMTAIRQPLSTAPLYLFLEDGVPTRSTGFFNHNALYEVNVPQADRIEVMKGPANALYGSDAIGGVINVGTRAPTEDTRGELSIERGEFGFERFMGSVSGTTGEDGFRLDANVTRTDGWRAGTGYERFSGTARWDRPVAGGSLKTVVTYSDIDQNTAGSSALSREDFTSNPFLNYTPISYRKVTALRFSSAFEKTSGAWNLSLTPFARANTMDILPNWSLTFDPAIWETENTSMGMLAKATYAPVGGSASLTVGADFDRSPGARFERAISPSRVEGIFTSYTEGMALYDYDVTFTEIAPYVHGEWTPSDRVHLSAGLRADLLGYDYDNHLSVVETGRHRRPADASRDFRAVSPKFGVTVAAAEHLDLFASYRRGFRAPSEGQLFRQGSALNTIDLDPVKVDSYETGLRGRVGSRLSYEVSAYYMAKTDDILAFRNPDGSTESVNAGETLHKGLEFGMGVQIASGLRLDAAYSVASHTYDDWRPSDVLDLSGNEMEFAPSEIGNVRLRVAPPSVPASVTFEWSRIGPYWMDAANTNEYEGHDLLNVRASVDLKDRIEVFGRLNNALDKRYAESASFNAFRGQELAPGMPRTLYLGIRVR